MTKKEEKQAGISGIYYEILMLNAAYSLYWQNEKNEKFDWKHNHILEATLVRIRSLKSVFEGDKSTKTHTGDVLACDYNFPAREIGLPPDLKKKIDKRIAHLTYDRAAVRNEDRHWDFDALIPPILNRGMEFFEFLIKDQFTFVEWPSKSDVEALITNIKSSKRSAAGTVT